MDTVLVDGRHAMHIHDGSLIAKIPSLTVTHTTVTTDQLIPPGPMITCDNGIRRCVAFCKARQRSESGLEWAGHRSRPLQTQSNHHVEREVV